MKKLLIKKKRFLRYKKDGEWNTEEREYKLVSPCTGSLE